MNSFYGRILVGIRSVLLIAPLAAISCAQGKDGRGQSSAGAPNAATPRAVKFFGEGEIVQQGDKTSYDRQDSNSNQALPHEVNVDHIAKNEESASAESVPEDATTELNTDLAGELSGNTLAQAKQRDILILILEHDPEYYDRGLCWRFQGDYVDGLYSYLLAEMEKNRCYDPKGSTTAVCQDLTLRLGLLFRVERSCEMQRIGLDYAKCTGWTYYLDKIKSEIEKDCSKRLYGNPQKCYRLINIYLPWAQHSQQKHCQ